MTTPDLHGGRERALMGGSVKEKEAAMRCVLYLRVSTREQAEKGEGDEGFSIPAQREACTRHIRDAGWSLVDEYADRGESARSADRPALQAMLARIAEDRDVDAVVVHKIDRLARNMEDHVAIRALLRRKGVGLVSVTENVEETASGRLVEGIHALMAEFYSANLAAEIKKGLSEKAKQGGFPHGAPLGYQNLREVIAGHQVARIVPDPERAPLITLAFEHYATGEWTLQRLAQELAHKGLTGRARRDRTPKAITWQGLAKLLCNPTYVGIVEWNGVQHPGTHEPLVVKVEELYQRIELPASWAERLREEMAAEVVERQRADAAQRELLTRRLAKAEGQRRKLLDAYYAGAIDVTTLKAEQARIGADIQAAKDRLADLDANLGEWQEILELAATFATRCADAYAKASDRTRKQFNAAVFERLDVKDGRLCHEQYRPPFDDIFSVPEFSYETRVEVAGIEPASSGFSLGLLRAQPTGVCRGRCCCRRRQRPLSGEESPQVSRSSLRASSTR